MSKHFETVKNLKQKYTKEYLISLANGINAFTDISRILNLDYKMTRRLYNSYDINYTFRLPFKSRKGFPRARKYETLEQAIDKQCTNVRVFKRLMLEKYGNICNKCKNTVWNGVDIYLQLHHIDGNNRNNLENNLELLCPNCHQQTDNFGFKKRK